MTTTETKQDKAAAETLSLRDLARQLDALDATTDWQTRTELGTALEARLGKEAAAEFSRRYEEVALRPAETVLRQMGLFQQEEAAAAAASLNKATAAYRHYRGLSSQAQVSEAELRTASLAWQAERQAFPGAPEQLQEACRRIDAALKAERARPKQHPHQLPGARAPKIDKAK